MRRLFTEPNSLRGDLPESRKAFRRSVMAYSCKAVRGQASNTTDCWPAASESNAKQRDFNPPDVGCRIMSAHKRPAV